MQLMDSTAPGGYVPANMPPCSALSLQLHSSTGMHDPSTKPYNTLSRVIDCRDDIQEVIHKLHILHNWTSCKQRRRRL